MLVGLKEYDTYMFFRQNVTDLVEEADRMVETAGNGAPVHDPKTYYKAETNADGTVRAYRFPRPDPLDRRSNDTILNMLDNVGCRYGDGERTRVDVAVAHWRGRRGERIAEALGDLKDDGCRVRVITARAYTEGDEVASLDAGVRDELNAQGLDWAYTGAKHSLHSKYILIDGYYDGARHKVVVTGSPNFTRAALRDRDETMVRVYDDALYDDYLENFGRLWVCVHGGCPQDE